MLKLVPLKSRAGRFSDKKVDLSGPELPLHSRRFFIRQSQFRPVRGRSVSIKQGELKLTANEFRRIALAFSGAVESAHLRHPDFRINEKVFATLGYPDENWGMVKLTPEQQFSFIEKAPDVFKPCTGAWGKRGYTNVLLELAKKTLVRDALETAVGNIASPRKRKRI